MVKFKIRFVVPAETLFSLMAKMLPIEDLHVEEVIERPDQSPNAMFLKGVEIAKKFEKAVRKPTLRKKRQNRLDLDNGINAILIDILKDGVPHRAVEMKAPVKAGGYSENSVGSRLQSLREQGVVEQTGDSQWRLIIPLKESA
jgi:hypothetical protein